MRQLRFGIKNVQPNLSVVVAAAAGIAISTVAWFAVATWEERDVEQRFAQNASDYTRTLQAGLDDYLDKLVALRAYFNASNEGVSRSEFGVFTRDLLDTRRAILSFSWIPRVAIEQRTAHELEGIRDGLPGYRIKSVGADGRMAPSPQQDEYFPVFYSNEPLTASSYGINLRDGGVRQRPLDRARDNDRMAASGSFRLQSGSGDRSGFFVVLPVYRRNAPIDTIDERRHNLVGFVQGVFQFHVMVDTILADVKSPLNSYLLDASGGPDQPPIHVRARDASKTDIASMSHAIATGPSLVSDLRVGDRHWKMVVVPSNGGSMLVDHYGAWIVLVAGLLITGSVVAYMASAIGHVRSLQAASDRAFALARTDPLTGLFNRRAFVEQLTRAFAGVSRGDMAFAVLFVDLDEFKDINDTQGHSTGDALLREVAARLKSTVRANDFVARFGGDEFAVLQADIDSPAAAGVLGGKIVEALGNPFTIDGVDLRVGASVGIALHSAETVDPDALLVQADLALYRAKDDGRNCFRFHSGELDQQVHLRVALAEELRTAIGRCELELHYQTQVEILSGRIIGLEALVRWNHPTRGELRPSLFVPVAERQGCMSALGQWMLAEACRQIRAWEDEGLAVPRLSIDISGVQLARPSEFEHDVAETFGRWGIRRGAIEFEIAESVLLAATRNLGDVLARIHMLGATFAIDEFGTGPSSLESLAIYPIRRLKIARALVAGIDSDARRATVVRSAVGLARDFGIESLAEGVEGADQARFLLDVGCECAQGGLYSLPVPAARISQLLGLAVSRSPGVARTGSES